MQVRAFQQLRQGKTDWQFICFPCLGASPNIFSEMAKKIPETMDVWSSNLPGHAGFSGKLLQDINSVIDLYHHELKNILDSNYLFFGHSMGGVIAYFLAQRIFNSAEYKTKPSALILSASGPPSSFRMKDYSNWSDRDLLNYVLSYGDISDEVIKEKNLLEYLIPVFRADFSILESTSAFDLSPLNIPVYFLWGENDPIISIDLAIQWSKYFTNEINLIPIENGSHMFIHDQLNVVIQKIDDILNSVFLSNEVI